LCRVSVIFINQFGCKYVFLFTKPNNQLNCSLNQLRDKPRGGLEIGNSKIQHDLIFFNKIVRTLAGSMIMLSSIVAFAIPSSAQYTDNVGIGTATPDPSALLELNSTTKGFLTTRLTQLQRDALTLPATGLIIFNTTAKTFQYNIGTNFAPIWVSMLYINIDGGSSSKAFWSLRGNNSVDAAVDFLGTRNDQSLIIKTNDSTRIILTPTGQMLINSNVEITGSLLLVGNTSPLILDGDPGVAGQVLVSRGLGLTPEYTDSLGLSRLSVSGGSSFGDTAVFLNLPRLPLNRGYMLVGDSSNIAQPFAPGTDSTFLATFNGTPVWFDLAKLLRNTAWIVGGNTSLSSPIIGNMDTTGVRDLDVRAGGSSLIYLNGTAKTIELKAPTNITGATSSLGMNGNEGISGSPLVSQGPALTPRWISSINISDTAFKISAPNFETSLSTNSSFYGPTLFTNSVAITGQATFTLLPSIPLDYGHILVGDTSNVAVPIAPGTIGSIFQIVGGKPTWVQPSQSAYWSRVGNAGISPTEFVGTTDANDLRLATDGQTRLTLSAGSGIVTLSSLGGTPSSVPLGPTDGVVVADANGQLGKVDKSTLLNLLGIHSGRFENSTTATMFTVVITMPVGITFAGNASINLTPEASTSVSITPFVVNGSRTSTQFTVNFPGGLNPGEALNWTVHSP